MAVSRTERGWRRSGAASEDHNQGQYGLTGVSRRGWREARRIGICPAPANRSDYARTNGYLLTLLRRYWYRNGTLLPGTGPAACGNLDLL